MLILGHKNIQVYFCLETSVVLGYSVSYVLWFGNVHTSVDAALTLRMLGP
jgi:hypothetical protein